MHSTFTPAHRGGSGTPLVCLHGFTDTWRTWELVLPALERHHDVLAPTLAGHAGGPPFEGEVDDLALVDGVEQAMDDAGFEVAHLVGNSLGGYVSLQLASRGRAQSVVALAPAGGWAHGDESYKETLDYFTTMQGMLKTAAPHAEAILSTPEGRRSATLYTATSFEHIPAELLAHARCGELHRGVAADRPCDPRVLEPRCGEDHLPRADRVGHRRQAPVVALGRRSLPPRLAAPRGLGRARGRRPLPQLDIPVETAQLILRSSGS